MFRTLQNHNQEEHVLRDRLSPNYLQRKIRAILANARKKFMKSHTIFNANSRTREKKDQRQPTFHIETVNSCNAF